MVYFPDALLIDGVGGSGWPLQQRSAYSFGSARCCGAYTS
jgi:hypothetical protein